MRKTKTRWILLLSLILAVSLGLSAACFSFREEDSRFVFSACVLAKEGNGSLLVYQADASAADRLCVLSTGKAALAGPDGKPISADALEPGGMIRVTAGGIVLAIWPAIYQDVYEISATGETNASLYEEGMKAAAPHLGQSG